MTGQLAHVSYSLPSPTTTIIPLQIFIQTYIVSNMHIKFPWGVDFRRNRQSMLHWYSTPTLLTTDTSHLEPLHLHFSFFSHLHMHLHSSMSNGMWSLNSFNDVFFLRIWLNLVLPSRLIFSLFTRANLMNALLGLGGNLSDWATGEVLYTAFR